MGFKGGLYVPVESNGGVPSNIQDQHTEMIVVPLHVELNTGSLLAVQTANDDTTVTLVGGHGAVPGNILCLKEGSHYYYAGILSVATNVLTMDSPLDDIFTVAGATVCVGNANLAVAGSLATPIKAVVSPSDDIDWDITRLHVQIIDDTAMDNGKFGGIAGLTNGVVLRMANGSNKNIGNVKNNGDLAFMSSNYIYEPKPPAAKFVFESKHVFAGQEHVGVTVRLLGGTNDELQAIIQDDLTGLDSLKILAIGHAVTD